MPHHPLHFVAGDSEGEETVDFLLMPEDRRLAAIVFTDIAGYMRSRPIATKYARTGNKGKAFCYLEKAFEEHDVDIPYISIDPIFNYMREKPHF